MGRTYSEEQIEELERHHGKDMVLVLAVGEDEYAFRRHSELDVELAIADKDAGKLSWAEEAAVRCVLYPDVPEGGKTNADDRKLEKHDLALLVAERERLRAEWANAPMLRDWIGQALAIACGRSWATQHQDLGGGRHLVTARPGEQSGLLIDDGEPVELEARSWTDREYDEYRRLHAVGNEGDRERYAYKQLIVSANKDEVARKYPWLVIGIGGALHTLGTQGKAVRLKKRKSGQPEQPTTSTSTGGAETSP